MANVPVWFAPPAGRFPPAVRGRRQRREAGARAGRRQGRRFNIKYVSLDDATASAGKWDPARCRATPARRRRTITIAYLGEFNSGASRSRSDPQRGRHPAGVAVQHRLGLTRSEGADKGEPDKYYPSGKRTYGRVVPADHIQAAAQVTYKKDNGCTKLYILNDKEVYGRASPIRSRRPPRRRASRSSATRASTRRPPTTARWRRRSRRGRRLHVLRWHHPEQRRPAVEGPQRHQPGHKLFGPDGVAESAFTEKLGSKAEKQTYITNPTLDPKLYPPSARSSSRTTRRSTARIRSRTRSTGTRR